MDAESRLRALLDDVVTGGVAPAVACAVACGDERGPRFVYSTGLTHRDAGAFPVHHGTIFDLASLTKVLATTLLVAHASARGRLSLDEAPWPSWPGVSVRNVLLHDGGLLWWAPFYERVPAVDVGMPRGADVVVREVLATSPVRAPGEATVYSDLGFIALGRLLEERLERPLHELFLDVARASYGDVGLGYVPIYDEGFHGALPDVAATTRCPWRGRVMQGQVDDDNCFAMGGAAGHAGLFGSVLDVERAARFHLAGAGAEADVLRAFSSWDGPRRLGYDRPTEGGSTGGAVGARGFGHLGFTGTSLWLDPDGPGPGGALYVLLTNRVCESRDNDAIKALRPRFHVAAREWLSSQLTG